MSVVSDHEDVTFGRSQYIHDRGLAGIPGVLAIWEDAAASWNKHQVVALDEPYIRSFRKIFVSFTHHIRGQSHIFSPSTNLGLRLPMFQMVFVVHVRSNAWASPNSGARYVDPVCRDFPDDLVYDIRFKLACVRRAAQALYGIGEPVSHPWELN